MNWKFEYLLSLISTIERNVCVGCNGRNVHKKSNVLSIAKYTVFCFKKDPTYNIDTAIEACEDFIKQQKEK